MEYVLHLEIKVKTKFVNLDRTYRRLQDLQSRGDVDADMGCDRSPVSHTSETLPPGFTPCWCCRRTWGHLNMCMTWIARTWRKFWNKVRRRSDVKGLGREVTLRLRCEEEFGEVTDFGNLEMAVGWYNAYLRVTFLYFTMMILLMLVATGLGWTLVRVIDMFVTLQQPNWQTSWSFMVSPVQVVMMSMGVSSMCILFQDQVRSVPLANVRATLLAFHVRLSKPKNPYVTVEQLVFTDVLFIANSLVWPIIWWQPVFGVNAAQVEVASTLEKNWGFMDHDPRTGVVIYLSSVTIMWLSARLGHLMLDFVAMCRREGSVDAGYLTYRIQRGMLQTKLFVGAFLVDWLCNRHDEAFLLFQEESGLRQPAAQGSRRSRRQVLESELSCVLAPQACTWRNTKCLHYETERDQVRFFQDQLRNPKVLKKCGMLYLDDLLPDPDSFDQLDRNSSKSRALQTKELESFLYQNQKRSMQEQREAQSMLDTRLWAIVYMFLWTALWAFIVMVSFSIQAAVGSLIPFAVGLYVMSRFCGHHPSLVLLSWLAFAIVSAVLYNDMGFDFTPTELDTWWSWRIVLMPGMVYLLQANWVKVRGRRGNLVEGLTSFLLVLPILIVPFLEHELADVAYKPYALIGREGMASDFAVDSPYPLCQFQWGGDAYRLNSLDLGALTFYSYSKDFEELEGLLNTTYTDVQWHLHRDLSSPVYSDPDDGSWIPESLPTLFVVEFPPNKTATRGTLVVAFRGTHTRRDFYADAASYTSVAILQTFQWYFFPILWDVPQKLIEWLLMQEQTPAQEDMIDAAATWVQNIVARFPEHDVVLSGHSLGGWFAEVIGIRLGLPAISWSGSGVDLRSVAEKLPARSHHKYVAVVPDGDGVPQIDRHSGVLQNIACPRQEKKGAIKIMNFTIYLTNAMTSMECHKVDRSMCELWRSCGDRRKRHFQCSGYVRKDDLGRDLPSGVKGGDARGHP